jgi:hypothetical protein
MKAADTSGGDTQAGVASRQSNTLAPVSDWWRNEAFGLSFVIAGMEWRVRIPALVLAASWTQLPLDPVTPPWKQIPKDIPLAMVPAQPVRKVPPLLSLVSGFRYVLSHENRHVLNIEGSFEHYMTKFAAKQRHNLRRQVRRLGEVCSGTFHNVEYQNVAELSQFHKMAMAISRKSPLHLKGGGLPESESGWRAVWDSVLCGHSCVWMSFHDARPVAYLIALGRREDTALTLWKIGYDPEYAQWSPGTVLLFQVIENLFARGQFSLLDFGPMEFDYKRWFATNHQMCANILYFRPSLKNAVLVLGHAGLTRSSELVGRILGELGMKERVRTALRFTQRRLRGRWS